MYYLGIFLHDAATAFSMAGSDAPVSNYPGKIPGGPDLPSDVAQEKLPEDKSSAN